MEIAPAIDLTADQRRTVLALLNHHLPNTTVWAYGSRVKWTSHPASNLDLVAFAKPEQAARLAELREVFDESSLPFSVDLFVWNDVPKDFRKRIEAEHVVLVKEEKRMHSEWPMTTLGTVVNNLDSRRVPLSRRERELRYGKYPYYGATGVMGYVDDFLFEGPHVLVAEDGSVEQRDGTPFTQFVRGKFWVNNHAHVLTGETDQDTRYLYYAISTVAIRPYVSGSVQAKLSQANLNRIPIPYPDAATRRATLGILGALDDKIELNRRIAETLEEIVRTLFKSWFADRNGLPRHLASRKMSNGWQQGALSDIASLNPESWTPATPPDKVAYVDLSNTKWGAIERIETYAWRDAPSRARRVLRPGDTIVGTVRPGNGSHALVGVEGLTGSTGFAVLRPKEDFDALFVWCAATCKSNIGRLAQLADGGAYPAVSSQAVAATKITLADVGTRRRFSDLTAPLADRMLAAYGEAHKLADLRDTLLPKLISGEIRIQDAEELAEAAT